MDSTEFLPAVNWETTIYDVVLISEETEENPAVWECRIKPRDYNDIGSDIPVELDFQLVDNAGHVFRITNKDKYAAENRVQVTDIFRVWPECPHPDLTGFVCKTVGDGESPHITPAMLDRLDDKAKDYLQSIEKDILWKYPKDINEKWHPEGLVFSVDKTDNKVINWTSGKFVVTKWPEGLESEYRIENVIDKSAYHPERKYNINSGTFTCADDEMVYIYAVVPVDKALTTGSIVIEKTYRFEQYYTGMLTILIGVYNAPDVNGYRSLVMQWNSNEKQHPPVTIAEDSADKATIGDNQVLHLTIPTPQSNKYGIVEGGIITWLYGLTYSLCLTKYYINGVFYTCPATIFTLDAADLTNPRIDLPVVNINSALEIIKGTPAENPLQPSIDVASQLELPFILLPANATQPSGVTNALVYDENIEWSHSVSGVVVDFDNTTSPFHGSKCASVGTIGNNDTISFLAEYPLNMEDFETLSLFLKLKSVASTKNAVYVQFRLAGVAVTQELPINWNINDITNWQGIAMKLSDFTFNNVQFDSIRLRWSRVQGTIEHAGFYLDYIKLQAGITQPTFVDSIELTGDVTGKGKTGTPFETTLKTVNSNVGSFGSATKTVSITVDAKGRITAISENNITGGTGQTPEFSTVGGWIVWRYVGDPDWIQLFQIPLDGNDGASAFVYIAYASAIDGTGFTLVDDPALAYSAVIATTSPIASPVVGNFAGHWYQRKGANGAPGSQPLQVTGITLTAANWALVGTLYEYDLANANITANSIVEVIPANASIATVKAAEVLPETDSSAGSVKLYAANAPSGDISVTINITEKQV